MCQHLKKDKYFDLGKMKYGEGRVNNMMTLIIYTLFISIVEVLNQWLLAEWDVWNIWSRCEMCTNIQRGERDSLRKQGIKGRTILNGP